MAPRNFNEDGAAGAGNSGGPFTPQSFGAATSNADPLTTGAGDLSSLQYQPGEINGPRTTGVNTGAAPSLLSSGSNPGNYGMPRAPTPSQSSGGFSAGPGSSYGGFGSPGGGINASGAPGLPYAFDDGGSMPDDQSGQGGDDLVSLALASVDSALDYGRNKYGLSGSGNDEGNDQQQASMMPAIPGSQSESGRPPIQPLPGPLPPTSNPFGRREQRPMGDAGTFQTAGMMPAIPGSQSDSGRPPIQPLPGPLPPTSNPFGRREQRPMGAIPDDQDEEAA
jgi:hypothetical protein